MTVMVMTVMMVMVKVMGRRREDCGTQPEDRCRLLWICDWSEALCRTALYDAGCKELDRLLYETRDCVCVCVWCGVLKSCASE